MPERSVTIKNPLGLHARAAAQVVRMATQYSSRICLRRTNGDEADAKSILGILHLAAACGTQVTIHTSGEDESDALDAIDALFNRGFGEI